MLGIADRQVGPVAVDCSYKYFWFWSNLPMHGPLIHKFSYAALKLYISMPSVLGTVAPLSLWLIWLLNDWTFSAISQPSRI